MPQPTPPAPPAPPTVVTIQTGTEVIPLQIPADASAEAVYRGLLAQRRELRSQLDRLQEQREDITRELRAEEKPGPAETASLEARLKEVDGRISAVESQIAQSDLAVAKAAAVPGAVVDRPPPVRTGPGDEVVLIPIVFTIFVLAPIAVAYARRIWKRGATVVAPVPKEVTERLDAMGQAVESIALEVERIGEGQRFLTRVMSDSGKALGAGAAQPIQVAQGERVGIER